ncbi:MAG: diacylglycerol kinase family protein [Dehalococcoidia bacterium]|nr:diacylglycerol kinase family protein [Dehalococcoidia bacterium]
MNRLMQSFRWAIEGVLYAASAGGNLRIHLAFAAAAVALAVFLGLSPVEWALLYLTISFVISMELINTSIEQIVNIISPEQCVAAKRAKDVAAAAVLIAACGSVFVGLFLFVPKFVRLS